jgi:2-oxoglutarate ferredoxin oxidoreductase subunit gamma
MSKTKGNGANTTSEIRIGGVGGQGIVLAGRLLGNAAALFDGKEAVCTQSYGPEARGGASRSDVIISDQPVDYPYVLKADVLAVLFQEAYARFHSRVKPGAMLIYDSGLVQPFDNEENAYGLPATKIAEELGSRLVTKIVILGYLLGKTGVVSREALEQAIHETVHERHVDLDLKALDAGISLAQSDGAS